ncbi:MAG: magnesium transporter [Actinomycetaceae bacterium]|nr:magnesium transporter [Actinomycetaceae bacterium]
MTSSRKPEDNAGTPAVSNTTYSVQVPVADERHALEKIEKIVGDQLNTQSDSSELYNLSQLLETLTLREVVHLVERLTVHHAAVLFRFLEKNTALKVFETLEAGHQASLIRALHEREVIDFFEKMDPDDRASLMDELPAKIADKLLRTLDKTERDLTGVVLGYPPDSIGRYMSPELLPIYDDMTVQSALDYIRQHAHEAETIYTLPVVDRTRHLVGVISFRELYTAQLTVPVGEVMGKAIFALADDNAESTARWFLPLDLLAMPIVDKEHRLVGILTVDDAHDIVESADTEDVARSGGHEPLGQPYLATPLIRLVKSRVVWLMILALSAVLTVHVLDIFEGTLQQAVVLALFIPLLTGTGGNTGNQAATTVTRALALGDVQTKDIAKVLWRELRVGFGLGLLLGSGGFVLAALVYHVPIGAVIGLTLLAVCTMAACVGGIMPIFAKMIGADPAVFSNPFISTFCDATGLIIYFLIAKAILGI